MTREQRAAADRLEKFAVEWGVMMARGKYADLIYGLHGGDEREAECRHSDICLLLELVAPTSAADQAA